MKKMRGGDLIASPAAVVQKPKVCRSQRQKEDGFMNHSSLTKNMVFDILINERFPTRFEDFCADFFSDVDGIRYVTTSTTWDHGRDARGVSTYGEQQPPFICCGTEPDVVSKAVSDTMRICETTSPVSILFCFNDPTFSEHKSIKIENDVRAVAPGLHVVRSFGADQLAQLVVKVPKAFENHYQGELANLRSALAASSMNDGEVELTGLRIALTTQLTDDAELRRKDLVRNLVLTALASGVVASIDQIAKNVSEQLHLARSVNAGWLQSAINDLLHSQHLARSQAGYAITDFGREEIKRRTVAGTKLVTDGQARIHELIETLTGFALGKQEWQLVWQRIQSSITEMFLSHGITIVESIESVVLGKSSPVEHDNFRSQIAKIQAALHSIPGNGERNEDIAQAVSDMFLEKQSPAFAWLASLCEVYVHLCALGLEPMAQHQILNHLQEIEILVDTDVVLSFLSTGDANHAAIETIIEGWKRVGGGIRVGEPCLEEAAHHAWISETDYEMTWRLFGKLTPEESQHEIENAFVRGYWAETASSNRSYTHRSWLHYISAFRGKTHLDFSKIEELLYDNGIEIIPDSSDNSQVAKHVSDFLFQMRKGGIGTGVAAIEDLQEKCDRDGRLLGTLLWRRKELASRRCNAFVVSTSMFLRHVGAILPDLKVVVPVLSVAAIAWLLSLAPGVRLSAMSLRGVLFDVDFPRHLTAIERVVTVHRIFQK